MKFVGILLVCLGLSACLHDPGRFALDDPGERPNLRQPGAW